MAWLCRSPSMCHWRWHNRRMVEPVMRSGGGGPAGTGNVVVEEVWGLHSAGWLVSWLNGASRG